MIDHFQAAIVRIYTADGKIVGTGFLVGERHILTCAHNVQGALGLIGSQIEMPQEPILVDFQMAAARGLVKAFVTLWQPPRNDGGDIAGLELEIDPPIGVQLVQLFEADDVQYHTFRTYGFPNGFDNGVTATGRLVGRQLITSWLQIEDIKETGQRVQPGFSGAPVWDEQLPGVVGMIVAIDRHADTKTAFMIPTDILRGAWSILSEPDLQIEKTSWKDGLSGEYLQIATEPSRTLRVLAGPGTGKTYS